MKKVLVFFSMVCFGSLLFAQQSETMYTQFYNSPLQINPANAGLFAGSARVVSNFKRQWENIGAPYQTVSGSGDFQLARNITGGDFIGMGIDINQDKSGLSELRNFNVNVSMAFTKALDARKEHFASVGFQGGFAQKSLTAANINWGSQWTPTGFDPNIYTPDAGIDEAVGYFDLGVGVNYFYSQSDDAVKMYIGAAMFHAAEPTISFLGDDELKLARKFNVNAGIRYQFGRGSNFSIYPNFIYSWQGTSNVLIYGSDLEYRISNGSRSTGNRKYTSFAVGVYHRWNQVLSPVMKLHKAGFTLAVSYDFEFGNITRVTNGMGGMELALRYQVGFRSGKERRNITNAFM